MYFPAFLFQQEIKAGNDLFLLFISQNLKEKKWFPLAKFYYWISLLSKNDLYFINKSIFKNVGSFE